jgi:multidrug efflux pump subunit AcrA (membrane-fusion protein)
VLAALTLAATVPLTRTVELSGHLVPERVVPVRPLHHGLVAEVLVAAGDTVAAGALLARLDGRALHAEREALAAERARLAAERRLAGAEEAERERAAEAALSHAQAVRSAARADYRRTAAVFGFAPGTEALSEGEHVALDEARAALAQAEAAVEKARYGGTDAWRAGWHVHAARVAAIDARLRELDVRLSRLSIRAPTSIDHGAVVFTEDLDRLRHARLDAGDALLDLAPLDAAGTTPLIVRALAGERAAQRLRPGMPARLTVTAVPTERPRQATGRVVRVGSASDDGAGGWRVELTLDPLSEITASTGSTDLPTVLRSGFTVDVAVEERRETLAHTAAAWVRERR